MLCWVALRCGVLCCAMLCYAVRCVLCCMLCCMLYCMLCSLHTYMRTCVRTTGRREVSAAEGRRAGRLLFGERSVDERAQGRWMVDVSCRGGYGLCGCGCCCWMRDVSRILCSIWRDVVYISLHKHATIEELSPTRLCVHSRCVCGLSG